MVSMVVKRTGLFCETCDTEVYVCNACGEAFQEEDEMICIGYAHFCVKCKEAK